MLPPQATAKSITLEEKQRAQQERVSERLSRMKEMQNIIAMSYTGSSVRMPPSLPPWLPVLQHASAVPLLLRKYVILGALGPRKPMAYVRCFFLAPEPPPAALSLSLFC